MLKSMTGFARATVQTTFGMLTCELRTVNHRYLDVQFRLPEELRPQEVEFRQKIADIVRRGKLECSLHLKRGDGEHESLILNETLAKEIGARLDDIATLVPQAAAPDPVALLRWPGVIQEPEIDAAPLLADAAALLDETLGSLQEMRGSEGARIAGMLESRCADILGIAASVRARIPEVIEAVRNKQKERIEALDVDADPARLEVELALISQKLDVDEELDRLDSHIKEIRDVLGRDDAVGRRLDFLMQELNREANTLGSKSADTETSRAAVDLKVLIEQMREQVQNVE